MGHTLSVNDFRSCVVEKLYALIAVKSRPNNHNISQHHWPSICKLRPNDRNISAQHMATLLSATCCASGHPAATCCDLLGIENRTSAHALRTWPNDYNIMQHPQILHGKFDQFQIRANNTQHVATGRPNTHNMLRYICCAEMLRSFGRGLSS